MPQLLVDLFLRLAQGAFDFARTPVPAGNPADIGWIYSELARNSYIKAAIQCLRRLYFAFTGVLELSRYMTTFHEDWRQGAA